MAETQMGTARARWASTTDTLSRMPLWRLAMAMGVFFALAAALVVLLLGMAGARGFGAAQALYAGILAAVGFAGYAVSKRSVLNGSVLAGIAGLGLILVGAGLLAVLAGLLLLGGAVWAYATSGQRAAPQGTTAGTR